MCFLGPFPREGRKEAPHQGAAQCSLLCSACLASLPLSLSSILCPRSPVRHPQSWQPSRMPGPQAGLPAAAALLRGAAPLPHRGDCHFTSLSVFSLQRFTVCTVSLKCNIIMAKRCNVVIAKRGISTLAGEVSDSRCRDNVRACEVSQLGSRSAPVQPAAALSLGVWAPLVGQGNVGRRKVLGTLPCECFGRPWAAEPAEGSLERSLGREVSF